jgi:hypothetical protein
MIRNRSAGIEQPDDRAVAGDAQRTIRVIFYDQGTDDYSPTVDDGHGLATNRS